MRSNANDFLAALVVPGLAALGGAFAVFAGYDDSPGGVLVGLLLILGAVALGWRLARRRV